MQLYISLQSVITNKNVHEEWASLLASPQKNAFFKIKNAHKRAVAHTLEIIGLNRRLETFINEKIHNKPVICPKLKCSFNCCRLKGSRHRAYTLTPGFRCLSD